VCGKFFCIKTKGSSPAVFQSYVLLFDVAVIKLLIVTCNFLIIFSA